MYHWWLYTHVVNTRWFIWSLVVMIFFLNIAGPFLIWYTMSSGKMPTFRKVKDRIKKMVRGMGS